MTTEQMDKVDEDRATDKQPSEPPAHIFTAIQAVMAQVRGFAKTGQITGGGQRYNFQRYEEMAEKIGELFREQHVMTQVQILDKGRDQWDKSTDRGSTRWTNAWVHNAYLFTSLVDGTSVHVEAMGEGADSSDKAFNKAMTGAYKNAFKTAFTLSTKEDDPDDERPEIPGRSGEVARNDPWGQVQLAVEHATQAEVSGEPPRQWTADQRAKVNGAFSSLPKASNMDDLLKMVGWAVQWDLLEAPVSSGGTFAGALLAARGALTGSPQ